VLRIQSADDEFVRDPAQQRAASLQQRR
jgi:hypothetical protein